MDIVLIDGYVTRTSDTLNIVEVGDSFRNRLLYRLYNTSFRDNVFHIVSVCMSVCMHLSFALAIRTSLSIFVCYHGVSILTYSMLLTTPAGHMFMVATNTIMIVEKRLKRTTSYLDISDAIDVITLVKLRATSGYEGVHYSVENLSLRALGWM